MSGAVETLQSVRLAADTSVIQSATAELSKLAADAPDAFVERLLRALDGGANFFCVGGHGAAAPGTNELTVTLQPTEFMNRLMATARAGEFDLSVFDHVRSSDGCLDNAIEGSPPGESQGPPGGQSTEMTASREAAPPA